MRFQDVVGFFEALRYRYDWRLLSPREGTMSQWNHKVGYALLNQVSLLRSLYAGKGLFFLCRKAVLWCPSSFAPTWCHTRGWRRKVAFCPQASACLKFRSNSRSSRGSWRGTQALCSGHSGWRSATQSSNGPPLRLPQLLSTPAHSKAATARRCALVSSSYTAASSHLSSAA